jgi:hypothetical protein
MRHLHSGWAKVPPAAGGAAGDVQHLPKAPRLRTLPRLPFTAMFDIMPTLCDIDRRPREPRCRAAPKIDRLEALENRHFEEAKIRDVSFLATVSPKGAYDAESTQNVEDPIYLGLT